MIKNIIRSLKLVWKMDKTYLFIEIGFSIISSALPILATWYSALFINKVVEGNFTSITDPDLITIVIIYLGIPLVISLEQLYRRKKWNEFYIFYGQYVEDIISEKKADIDIQTYENPKFNNLMEKARRNSMKCLAFIDSIFGSIKEILRVVMSIIILASYQWWIAIVLIIALIPELYLELKYGKRAWGIWDAKASIKRKYYEAEKHFDSTSSLIEMKIFGTRKYFRNIINQLTSDFNLEIAKNISNKTTGKVFSILISYVASTLVILYFMNDVLAKTLAIGTFTFLLVSMSRMQSSIMDFFSSVGHLNEENLFVKDIFKFLDTHKVLKNGHISLTRETPDIEFKDVHFKYPDTEKYLFKNLNFKINAGEKIAIVGVNGAGKTTLTKLIMRFYDPSEGTIFVGGNELKEINQDSYLEKIGYLSQDYDYYKMHVKDAIAVGDTSVQFDMDRVVKAAKKAGAHTFIEDWKGGYDAYLGKEFEDGIEPSVGQWQKLALARLFYRDPQIWILDEPTASIDAVAEMEIFEELENLPNDKTVILISHRFNTVKNADRIMVIEHGEIIEFDTHDKLIAKKKGVYKELFTAQKDSFETV